MPVIDSDRHVVEPEEVAPPYPPGLAPGRKAGPTTGRYHPIWGDREFSAAIKVPAGPDEQLADMDLEGIDAAVLYPTLGLGIGLVEDLDGAQRAARAYNDWLAGVYRAAPDRLKGIALVAPREPAAAADELRRAVRERGLVGAMLPTWIPGLQLGGRELDPLYAAAAELGVPVGMHAAVPAEAMPPRFADYLSAHAVGHTTEQMAAICSLVVGGVLERHPDLRVAFLESGIGWVPYWLERLDEHYEKLQGEVPYLAGRPGEYLLGGRCYFHVEVEERVLPYAIEVLGDDCLMYASDYPHWDCAFPDSVRLLRERTDLSETSKRKILGENAARFYGLSAPTIG